VVVVGARLLLEGLGKPFARVTIGEVAGALVILAMVGGIAAAFVFSSVWFVVVLTKALFGAFRKPSPGLPAELLGREDLFTRTDSIGQATAVGDPGATDAAPRPASAPDDVRVKESER
jgi:hypothetical protein